MQPTPRKQKRAAALAASAATTASAKRPRLTPRSAHQRPDSAASRQQRGTSTRSDHSLEVDGGREAEDEDEEGESISTDDASSIRTTDDSKPRSSSVLDEWSSALMEDKMTVEEMAQHLPGPPDRELVFN